MRCHHFHPCCSYRKYKIILFLWQDDNKSYAKKKTKKIIGISVAILWLNVIGKNWCMTYAAWKGTDRVTSGVTGCIRAECVSKNGGGYTRTIAWIWIFSRDPWPRIRSLKSRDICTRQTRDARAQIRERYLSTQRRRNTLSGVFCRAW